MTAIGVSRVDIRAAMKRSSRTGERVTIDLVGLPVSPLCLDVTRPREKCALTRVCDAAARTRRAGATFQELLSRPALAHPGQRQLRLAVV